MELLSICIPPYTDPAEYSLGRQPPPPPPPRARSPRPLSSSSWPLPVPWSSDDDPVYPPYTPYSPMDFGGMRSAPAPPAPSPRPLSSASVPRSSTAPTFPPYTGLWDFSNNRPAPSPSPLPVSSSSVPRSSTAPEPPTIPPYTPYTPMDFSLSRPPPAPTPSPRTLPSSSSVPRSSTAPTIPPYTGLWDFSTMRPPPAPTPSPLHLPSSSVPRWSPWLRNMDARERAHYAGQDMNLSPFSFDSPAFYSLLSSMPMPKRKRLCRNCAGQAQPTSPRNHRDAEQIRRQNDYLRKVRQTGDDRRWRSRGDQILRDDYVSRRKRWEEEQAKYDPYLFMAPEAEEQEVWQEYAEKALKAERERIDDILQHERQELDTLISRFEETRLEESSSTAMEQKEAQTTEEYGSDDEDFVLLCREALLETETRDSGTNDTQEAMPGSTQDVDMSSG
ncbi:hypothetical protein MMC07_007970 [Pseudocyphellaria aurata]|nr:hypothetical protein [Pseudocyphellaria aurata]